MIIERVTKQQQITKLMTLDDDVEQHFNFDRGEWIQWLMKSIENDNILILQALDEGSVSAYLVAAANIKPPISKSVFVLYCYAKTGPEDSQELMGHLKTWAKNKKADSIRFGTKTPRVFRKYGFVETGKVIMEMDL